MAYSKEELDQIYEQVLKLRNQIKQSTGKETYPSVDYLKSKLINASDDNESVTVMTMLQREYGMLGLVKEEEDLLRDMTVRFSEEPMPWISLAEFLLYTKADIEEAKKVVLIAVEKAVEQGNFIRHAYNTQARIAKTNKDFNLLESTLKKLIDYSPKEGSHDVAKENDIVKNIPEGVINQDTLNQYMQTK